MVYVPPFPRPFSVRVFIALIHILFSIDQKLHTIIRVISRGRRPTISEYRTEQNAITDQRTGKIVYLPPEPHDVPALMEDLVAWVNHPETQQIPASIKAGIFM